MNKIMQDKTEHKKSSDADAFVVRRSLHVPGIDKNPQKTEKMLTSLKGVRVVDVDLKRGRLTVTYDASQTGFWVIEKILDDTGKPIKKSGWSRFKSSWYRYLDENAQNNAKSKGGACCSKPSDIYANRRK